MNRLLLNLQKVDGDAARGWAPEQLQLLMAKAEMNDGDVIFRGMWKGKTPNLGAHGQGKFSVDEVEQAEITKARTEDQFPQMESEFSVDASMGAGEAWLWVSTDNAWPRADAPYDYAYWQPVLMNTNAGTGAQYSLLANPPEVSWLSARATLEHSAWQPVLSDAGNASDLTDGGAHGSPLTDSWLKPDTGWSTGYGANDYGYWQPADADAGQRWLFASAEAPASIQLQPEPPPYLPLIAVGGLILIASASSSSTPASSSSTPGSQSPETLDTDTTAPGALGLALSTDSGTDTSDGVTNISAVNVSGLEAGSTWEYQVDSGEWTAGSGSSFTLSAGSHAYSARQTDAAGNLGEASTPTTFDLDIVAPNLVSTTVNAVSKTVVMTFDEALSADALTSLATLQVTQGGGNLVQSISASGAVLTVVLSDLSVGDASIVYTDAAGDDDVAIEDAAGNDVSSFTKTIVDGVVVDGYVAGAAMFVDVDGDGVYTAGTDYDLGETNATGLFFLPDGVSGTLVAEGGTNIDTGLPNQITLKAPAGSSVINPLTTVVQAFMDADASLALSDAMVRVTSMFALDTTLDLTTFDPLNADNFATSLPVQKVATQLATLMTVAQRAELADTVTTQLIDMYATFSSAGEPYDLSDAGVLSFALGLSANFVNNNLSGFSSLDADLEAQVHGLDASNAAIKIAATFEDIASAQASALDTTASAAPVTVDLLATGDSGVSTSDNITQETNLTVRVTLPTDAGALHDLVVGDLVNLRYDGVGVLHPDANADGRGDADAQVTLTDQHLSDGYVDLQLSIAHYSDGAGDMVAWFTDKAGNLSAVNDALSVQLVTQAVVGGVVMTDNHNGTFKATVDFGADAVYGLREADWSVIGGTVIAGSLALDANAYSVNIQATADVQTGLMIVDVDTSGVTGVAGNGVLVIGAKQPYDSLAPHVLSVDTPSVGTFGVGQDLVFTVNFSENVTLDASTSALSIRVGEDERTATFTSGSSDANTWVYTYTVQGIDGATGSGLTIVGLTGTVGAQDAAGNVSDAADLFVEKTVSGVVVDGSTQGQVADGYISGATVFADNDGSGSLSSGDSIAIANATGGLKIYGATGPMVMYGGTDISTGLDFGVQYEAPVGFTVINPITSLVQAAITVATLGNVDPAAQVAGDAASVYDASALRLALFGDSVGDRSGVPSGPSAAQLASYEPFQEVMASGTVAGITAAVSYQQLAAVIATVVEVTSQAMSVLDTAHTQREHSTTVFDALAVALSDGGVSSAGALASLADASTGALADVLAATLGARSSINDAGAATAAGVVLSKAVGSIASIALTDGNASGAIDSSDGLKTLTDITKAQQTAQGKSGDVLGQYLTDMAGGYGQTVDQYMDANSLADLGTHYATFTDFFNGTVATASVGVIVPVSYEIRGGTISDVNANAGVLEGQPGDGGILTFTVTRGGDTSGESAIGWSVANNTGVDASQFAAGSALSGTIDFAAGETQREITLVLEGNTVREPNYALRVDLIDESGVAKIDHPSAFVNIVDDDPFIPVISAHNPADVLVGDAVPLSLSLDYFDATAPMTVELVASGGTLANYTAANFASATLSDLNALLAAVTFTAEIGAVDALVTMNVSIDGTNKTAFSTSPIQVHSAPVIDVDTTAVTVDGGAAVDLPTVALYDVDSDSVLVTLSASGGLLRIPQADGTLITMSNWVFSGTPEAATQALAELSFWAQPGARAGVVKVQLSDGDAMTAGATQLLNFAIQAAAPVIHVPSYQSLVTRGVASHINDIWVSDTDSNNVSVVLTAANGVLNVATSSAVTLIGNGSSTMTLQGSVDAVNAQLSSLTFTASAGTLVPLLTAKVSDGITTTSATTVSLNAIANTPPDAGGNLVLDAVVTEDGGAQALGITADGLTLNDPDGGTVTHVRVLSVIGGSLGGITSVGAASTPLSLAEFEALTFTPAKNFNGEASIKYVVVDSVLTSLNSSASTITFQVAAVNDAPSVTGTASSVTYIEHGASVLLAPTVTLQDVDSATLSKVEIVADANWSATSTLSVAGLPSGITLVKQDAATYVLSGSASVSDYQAALRALSYSDSGQIVSDATLGLTLKVYDVNAQGGASATPPAWTISLGMKAHNDAPTVSSVSGTTLAYTEGDGATALFAGVALVDVDSSNLSSAKVQISAGYRSGQDVLVVNVQALSDAGLTSTFDAVSGTLTLKGVASVAAYQSVIESVAYQNNAQAPSEAARTVSLSITDDQGLVSSAATRAVAVSAVADAPDVDLNGRLVAGESSALTYTYGLHHSGGGLLVASQASLSDVDSSRLSALTLELTQNAQAGDALRLNAAAAAVAANAGLVVSGLGTGTLTLTGSATLLDYEKVLRGVLFDADTVANLGFTGGALPPSRALTVTATDATGAGVVTSVVASIAQTESSFAFASGANLYLFGDPGSSAAGDIETVSIDLNAKVISVDGNPLKVDGAPFFGVTNVYGADADGTVDGSMSGVSVGVSGAQLKVSGTSGDNIIVGTSGNDEIRGGGGNDTLAGGAGDDLFYDQAAGTVDGGEGTDTLLVFSSTHSGSHVSATGVEIISAARAAQGVTLTGQLSDATTTLVGSGFADTVVAADGLTLSGGAGSDTFDVSLLTNGQTASITDAAIGEVVVTASTATESGGVITTAEGAVITVANWGTGWSLQQDAVTSTNYHVVVTPTQTPTIISMTRDSGTSASDWLTNDGGARLIKGSIDAPLEASQVLEVSVNGGSTWSAALVDGRAWQFFDSTSARTEDWVIKARVTDTRTNVSSLEADWATQIVSFDATAPAALAVSASGMTNPALVSDAAYTFGSDDASARTEYSLNYTNAASDVWSSVKPSLHEGANTIYFRQIDGAGNVSAVHTWNVSLDTSPPVITSVVVSDGAFTVGEAVQVTVTFDGEVSFSNNATTIDLVFDGGEVAATFVSATTTDGVTSALFTYLVQAGDSSSSGVVVKTNGLTLDSGTIRDAAGNDAVLTFTSVVNPAAIVDTTAPTPVITSFDVVENALALSDEGKGAGVLQADEAVNWSWSETQTGNESMFTLTSDGVLSLNPGQELDFEADSTTVTLNVVATDAAGNATEQELTVSVLDVNEAPTLVVDAVAPKLDVTEADTQPQALPTLELIAGQVEDQDAEDVLSVDVSAGHAPTYTLYIVTLDDAQQPVRTVATGDQGVQMKDLPLATAEGADPVWLVGTTLVVDPSHALLQSLPEGGRLEAEVSYTVVDAAGVGVGSTLKATVGFDGVNDAPSLVADATAPALEVTEADSAPATMPTVELVAGQVTDIDEGDTLSVDTASAPPTYSVFVVDAQGVRTLMTDEQSQPVSNQTLALSAGSEPLWLDGTMLGVDPSHAMLQGIPEGGRLEIDVTYAVVDASGASSASITATVGVTGVNDAPTLVGTVSAQVAVNNQAFTYDASSAFADVDEGDVLSYAVSGLPEGLSIDATTGEITGTATTDQVAATVTVTATDAAGLSVSQEFDLSVVSRPVVQGFKISDSTGVPTAGRGGEALSVEVVMTEAVTVTGTPTEWQLTFAMGGQSFSANYASGTGTVADPLIFTGAVAPATGDGNAITLQSMSSGAAVVTGNLSGLTLLESAVGQSFDGYTLDNTAPTVAATSLVVDENTTATSGLSADEAVTWAWTAGASGDEAAFTLGSDGSLSLNSAVDFETGTTSYTLNVDVTDAVGNVTQQVISVSVEDVNEAPTLVVDAVAPKLDVTEADTQPQALPTLELIAGQVEDQDAEDVLSVDVSAGHAPTYTLYIMTLDDAQQPVRTVATGDQGVQMKDLPLATAEGADPVWLVGTTLVVDPSHALLQSLPEGGRLEAEVSYTVVDAAGVGVGSTLKATVGFDGVNDAPVADGVITAQTVTNGQAYSLDVSTAFKDVDDGDALSFSATSLPSGLIIDAATGVISGTATTDQAAGTVTVTATDVAGLTATQSFDLEVTTQVMEPTITGTDAGDLLAGTDGNDVVAALAGDDDIQWSLGQDWIDGGLGFDVLSTGLSAVDAGSATGSVVDHSRMLTLDTASVTLTENANGSFTLDDGTNSTTLDQIEAVGLLGGGLLLLNVDQWEPLQGVTRYDGTVWNDAVQLDVSTLLSNVTTGALTFDDALDQIQIDGAATLQLSNGIRDGESVIQLTQISDGALLAEFASIESFVFNLGISTLTLDHPVLA